MPRKKGFRMRRTPGIIKSGDPPCKPPSEIGEIVEEILGTADPSVCGIPDAPDPALLKLKELQRRVDNAGAGPSDASSPVSSQDISLCPPDEPSASQDTGFAQGAATEDAIQSSTVPVIIELLFSLRSSVRGEKPVF
ncbi:unnamed protein product [Leuciscus chuanchicus]